MHIYYNSNLLYMMYNYGAMGGLGGIMMLFWWVVGIVFVVWLIRTFAQQSHHGCGHGDSALYKLRERYAKGEIDNDEYHERKKVLTGE